MTNKYHNSCCWHPLETPKRSSDKLFQHACVNNGFDEKMFSRSFHKKIKKRELQNPNTGEKHVGGKTRKH